MPTAPPGPPLENDAATPLVVDADGALTSTDLFIEGVARLVARFPLKIFALPFWLLRGSASLKRQVAEAVPLPPSTLVLNPVVLREIDAAKAAGREVWLASGADERAVEPLAEAVGAAGCIASDGDAKLTGETRAAALVARFGENGFDYLAARDAIWRSGEAPGSPSAWGSPRVWPARCGRSTPAPSCYRVPAAPRSTMSGPCVPTSG